MFKGYKALERWRYLGEERIELFAEGEDSHVKALLALQPPILDKVAVGGDWPLSWSVLPFADPTDPSPWASMTVQQYATGVACLKDLMLVQDRCDKRNAGSRDPKGKPQNKGPWTQLSQAHREALEKWKKKNPGK